MVIGAGLPWRLRTTVVVAAVDILLARQLLAERSCPSPELTTVLFSSLNLSLPGLTSVAAAHARGATEEACSLLCSYYMASDAGKPLRLPSTPAPGTATVGGDADAALKDVYSFYGEVSQVPRNVTCGQVPGGLDWVYWGPIHDEEYFVALNRHAIFDSLLTAWNTTGNPSYPRLFDNLTADWVCQYNPAPVSIDGAGKAGPWETLQAGIRASGPWPAAFYGFQQAAEFRNSTRLAMLASIAEHGQFLNKFASRGNANFRSMQYHGLANLAAYWPEFLDASAWLETACAGIVTDVNSGVYPDGVETEQTSSYHLVALHSFDHFVNTVRQIPHLDEHQLHATNHIRDVVERMWNYTAYAMDGVGFDPLNSDSDLTNDAAEVAGAASRFNRSDWLYLATRGQQGVVPAGPVGAVFDWAGQVIMRSDWTGETVDWAWFDVGPFGSSGHGHYDRLHLSIRSGSQSLLTDSGRFAYDGELAPYREQYGSQTQGHNVIMLNGCGQAKGTEVATAALAADSWGLGDESDFAFGSAQLDSKCLKSQSETTHTRAVVHVREKRTTDEPRRSSFWIVVDRLQGAAGTKATVLWHTHPNATMTVDPQGSSFQSAKIRAASAGLDVVLARDGREESRTFDGGQEWVGSIVKGRTGSSKQGWYSSSYGQKQAADCLELTGTVPAGTNYTMAWLLVPVRGASEPKQQGSAVLTAVSDESATVSVLLPNQPPQTIVVRLKTEDEGAPTGQSNTVVPTCSCPGRAELCKPLASGPPAFADVHVYSDGGGPWINQSASGDTYDWRQFDLSVVTTIVRMAAHPITVSVDGSVQLSTKSAYGPADAWPESELVCTAHDHGVRVLVTVLPELKGPGTDPLYYQHLMANATAVQRMADELATIVSAAGFDGIEFDFEVMTREMSKGNTFDFGKAHVAMIQTVRQTLKKANPHSTTALTLYGGNGGNPQYPSAYPAASLSEVADQIFVMAYDMWHHHTVCAGPNSPTPGVMASIQEFIDAGAAADKLILGMPWYGYMYHCNNSLAFPSKFKPCDDPALGGTSGTHHCLVGTLQNENEQSSTAVNWWQMDDLLNGRSPSFPSQPGCERHWSDEFSTPYVNCPKGAGPFVPAPHVGTPQPAGDWSQIWYEDLNSTKIKIRAAKMAKLGGIGVFTGEAVGANPEMWKSLAAIK